MDDAVVDTRDMLAVHRAFRREFAALGDLVASVPDGDTARANIVGEHILAMITMVHSHHASEDEVLWTIIESRAPEHSSLASEMEGQHALLDAFLATARTATQRWMMTASSSDAGEVTWAMEQASQSLEDHLAREEADVLPLVPGLFTQAEWASVGTHSRAGLTQRQLDVSLGVIEDAASDEEWTIITRDMPPAAAEAWRTEGRKRFDDYRAQLAGA